jgi:hypothetical protein
MAACSPLAFPLVMLPMPSDTFFKPAVMGLTILAMVCAVQALEGVGKCETDRTTD